MCLAGRKRLEVNTYEIASKSIEAETKESENKVELKTKTINEQTLRHLIAWIKEQIFEKKVERIDWVCSDDMIADVFTKANVKTEHILQVLRKGALEV